MKEHLASISFQDGKNVDVGREDGNVVVSHGDNRVTLKKATGRQTLDMLALLEGLGGSIEDPESEGDHERQ